MAVASHDLGERRTARSTGIGSWQGSFAPRQRRLAGAPDLDAEPVRGLHDEHVNEEGVVALPAAAGQHGQPMTAALQHGLQPLSIPDAQLQPVVATAHSDPGSCSSGVARTIGTQSVPGCRVALDVGEGGVPRVEAMSDGHVRWSGPMVMVRQWRTVTSDQYGCRALASPPATGGRVREDEVVEREDTLVHEETDGS